MPVEAPAAPAPTQPGNPGPNLSEAFANFDALVAAPDPGAHDAPPEPPKTDDTAPEDVATAGDEKTGDKTPPADKAADPKTLETKPAETPAPKEKAATLRDMLARTRTEAADWKAKYEKLAAESAKPKTDAEKEQLLKDREQWNKSRAELENELKFAKYEASQEFKDKYQQPFLKAYEQAAKLMASLSFKEADKLDALGEIETAGQTRKGTEADWERLMAITDEDAANQFIAEHFGHNAARVTVLRDKVFDLHNQMRLAVEDFRKQGSERENQMRELMTKQQKEISDRWHQANVHAVEKYPDIFGPDPNDTQANTLLEQGQRLTDLAFNALDPADFSKLPASIQSKMVDGKLPPVEQVLLHSAIRNRSAVYDRDQYRISKLRADLKAANDKLAGYEKSEPGRGQPRKTETPGKKGGVASTLAEVDAEFDRLAAGNG